jgi:hypothetical protein
MSIGRRERWLLILTVIGLGGALAEGCGGGDGTVIPVDDAGADQGLPDGTPVPPSLPPPPPPPDATVGVDAGADAAGRDASDATVSDAGSDGPVGDAGGDASDGAIADAADAGCTLTLTSMTPSRGWNGVDIAVTIGGTGFLACSGDGGADAGCPDRFKLVGSCNGDGGLDAGACADAGDSGVIEWPLTTLSVPSSTTALATVPAGGPVGGPYSLVDTQNACTAPLPNAYTILPATVTVSSVTPAYGWTGESTPITVTGAGFISTPQGYVRVPTMSPQFQKLRGTAFVSTTSLTSMVPQGLAPGGPYDIAILNPDGTGGSLANAFRVVNNPVPSIESITPGSLTTTALGTANNLTITGCNFRNPLTVATVSSTGTVTGQTAGALSCAGAQTCPGNTRVCTLQATIGAGLAEGPYVVRVTNSDENTAGEYAVLVVTDPAAKLDTGYALSPSRLNVARRSHGALAGRIDDASRYLYAIGGENAAGTPLASIEVAPLDRFGTLGTWFAQRYALNTARSGAAVARAGKYVYVAGGTATTNGTGGTSPSGVPLATIERAKILDQTDVPFLNDPTTLTTGNLASGSWYYKVAAVRSNADPSNPNGETLASDEAVVTLTTQGSAVLTWTAPTNSANIAFYRIYRTPAANGSSQQEVLLYETANANTTFTDDGSFTPGTQTPLARGSTGIFVTLTQQLVRARFNAGASVAADPNGQSYLYLVGGHGTCGTGGADAGPGPDGGSGQGAMDCYELATLTADGSTLGALTAGTNALVAPRARHGVATMNAQNGITPWTGNAAFVFASGGTGPTNPTQRTEYAVVTNGGQLGAWAATNSQYGQSRDGSQLQIANGFLYAFFGGSAATYTSSADFVAVSAQTATTVTLANAWSSAVSTIPANRGRMGVALESAYFYVIGGTSNDSDATDTVYYILY